MPNLRKSGTYPAHVAWLHSRRRLVIVLATLGVAVAGFVAVVTYQVTHTTSVTVLNDGREITRLSGCQIDDALDLNPGETAPLDVDSHGRTGCNVFVGGKYQGCLIVDTRAPRPQQPIRIQASVDREVKQSECEAVG